MTATRWARGAWALTTLLCLWAIGVMGQRLLGLAPGPAAESDPFGVAFQTLVMLVFPMLTGLILFRQPRNLIGWLLLMPQGLLSAGLVGNSYLAGLAPPPDPAPLPLVALVWFLSASWIPFIFSLVLLPVFFPTGRPPGPRWWWLVAALVAHGAFFLVMSLLTDRFSPENLPWSVHNPIGFVNEAQFAPLFGPWIALLAVLVVLCLAALFVRYRGAGAVVRTQIRWLLYACSLFVLIYLPQLFVPLETPSGAPTPIATVLNIGFGLAVLLIPAAIAVSILRYRLWDIDVIIRRTLVYSTLTALLALAYFGSVLVLQSVFQAVTGEGQNALVTVLSTLLIAALFGPLRARVQRLIDRRFFRQKYDAARTLAAFGAQARDVVALDQLSEQLVGAVDETMQPAHAALWVKPAARPREG